MFLLDAEPSAQQVKSMPKSLMSLADMPSIALGLHSHAANTVILA